ncbi:MAG: signal peptidase II [Dehalococcoidia bacterium]|nr:MAG: signal peptidase II [Dehalococcoidia bacterium]
MQKANRLQDKWWIAVFSLTASLVVAADQLTKMWIRANLAVGQSLPETGLPQLTHVHNTGAAFGLFSGQNFLLIIVALIGIALLLVGAVFIYRRPHFLNNRLAYLSLGLILGGTVGNLIDRLRLGYVTDFIDFGFWPAFNIADSAIVVGVIIFAISFPFLAKVAKG